MKFLRLMWKRWRQLWRSTYCLRTGVDSHKWESKLEILRDLSGKR
ncbi:MAG: hypothetical protein ACYS4W_06355 [Planctomycetota bacterium]